MNRRLLAALALVVVLGLSGCTSIFGTNVDDPEALSQDADYAFDTDSDAYIEANRENYTAVYNVSAKRSDGDGIELYTTDALTIEQPLELSALQFRYPNGTVVRYVDGEPTRVYENGTTEQVDALDVGSDGQRTTVELPADEGRVAFTTPRNGKQLTIHTPVTGSYELVLPPDTDASLPLLSQVRPSNDGRTVVDGRVHLTWQDLDSSVLVVRWYLDRDLWLFGGLATIALGVGLVGSVYYYLQIRRARRRREAEGIDVEYDDRDGPPPGM